MLVSAQSNVGLVAAVAGSTASRTLSAFCLRALTVVLLFVCRSSVYSFWSREKKNPMFYLVLLTCVVWWYKPYQLNIFSNCAATKVHTTQVSGNGFRKRVEYGRNREKRSFMFEPKYAHPSLPATDSIPSSPTQNGYYDPCQNRFHRQLTGCPEAVCLLVSSNALTFLYRYRPKTEYSPAQKDKQASVLDTRRCRSLGSGRQPPSRAC